MGKLTNIALVNPIPKILLAKGKKWIWYTAGQNKEVFYQFFHKESF